MTKRMRRAWGRRYNVRSAQNNKAYNASTFPIRSSMNVNQAESRAKHEAHLDKVLRDSLGIDRWKALQPGTGTLTQPDPWIQVQATLRRVAEDLANPKMFTICLSNTKNIKVYLIWGHGGSLVAHQYYVHEYNVRMRRLRQSYQFGTRERAMDAWTYDRVQWKDTVFLPAD